MKADKELDEILEKLILDVLQEASKEFGEDIYIQTFPDEQAKAAIQNLIDTRVREGKIMELKNLIRPQADMVAPNPYTDRPVMMEFYAESTILDRLKELKEGKQNGVTQ